MKKCLVILFALCVLLTACGGGYDNGPTCPQNGIFDAPGEFYLEWDIPSIRDISVSKEGYYSMPVYQFETLEELLHLKDIVGMEKIGNEGESFYCYACGTEDPCPHEEYSEEFFEYYDLLIGWHQYAGVVIPMHTGVVNEGEVDEESQETEETEEEPIGNPVVAKYEIKYDGSIVVSLQGERAEGEANGQWILVAVPKNRMADCDSVTFLVSLPEEE